MFYPASDAWSSLTHVSSQFTSTDAANNLNVHEVVHCVEWVIIWYFKVRRYLIHRRASPSEILNLPSRMRHRSTLPVVYPDKSRRCAHRVKKPRESGQTTSEGVPNLQPTLNHQDHHGVSPCRDGDLGIGP